MVLLTVMQLVFDWNTAFHLCMTILWLPSPSTAELSIYDETVKNKIFSLIRCRQHVLSSTQTSLVKLGDCCFWVLAISFQIFPLLPALTMINAHGLGDMTSKKILNTCD